MDPMDTFVMSRPVRFFKSSISSLRMLGLMRSILSYLMYFDDRLFTNLLASAIHTPSTNTASVRISSPMLVIRGPANSGCFGLMSAAQAKPLIAASEMMRKRYVISRMGTDSVR